MRSLAKTKYYIELSAEDKTWLKSLIENPETTEKTVIKAKILLVSDISYPEKLSVPKVAELVGTSHTTVQKTRAAYANDGIATAVLRKIFSEEHPELAIKRTDYSRRSSKLTDENIEKIRALRDSEPPEGYKKWTYTLLAEECVKRGIVDKIGKTTIARYFKDNP